MRKKLIMAVAAITLVLPLSACNVDDQAAQNTDRARMLYNYQNGNQLRNLAGTNEDTTPIGNAENNGNPNAANGTTDNGAQNNGANNGNGKARGKTFKDIQDKEDAWYQSEVSWGADNEVISGFPDGTFQPNKPLTRAEALKILRSLALNGYFNIPEDAIPPSDYDNNATNDAATDETNGADNAADVTTDDDATTDGEGPATGDTTVEGGTTGTEDVTEDGQEDGAAGAGTT